MRYAIAEKALGEVQFGVELKRGEQPSFPAVAVRGAGREVRELLTSENVRSIRPGHGLHTRHLPEVLGRRAACDIERGTPLQLGTGQPAMRIVSPFLKKVLYPSLSAAGCFHRPGRADSRSSPIMACCRRRYKPVDPAFDGNLIKPRNLRSANSPPEIALQRNHSRRCAGLAGRRRIASACGVLTCDDGLLEPSSPTCCPFFSKRD